MAPLARRTRGDGWPPPPSTTVDVGPGVSTPNRAVQKRSPSSPPTSAPSRARLSLSRTDTGELSVVARARRLNLTMAVSAAASGPVPEASAMARPHCPSSMAQMS